MDPYSHAQDGISRQDRIRNRGWAKPGKITAITLFAVGRTRRQVTGRILSEVIGDVEAPLAWLGFEDSQSLDK
jgi:hypothetical protein